MKYGTMASIGPYNQDEFRAVYRVWRRFEAFRHDRRDCSKIGKRARLAHDIRTYEINGYVTINWHVTIDGQTERRCWPVETATGVRAIEHAIDCLQSGASAEGAEAFTAFITPPCDIELRFARRTLSNSFFFLNTSVYAEGIAA
jgi:hypothetical protein